MDDLLREFLIETGERLDVVDAELVRFERDPNDATILRNIFRLVHTIKGTCGFLGLPRLEALAHAAETLIGHLQDGMPVTRRAVTLILATLDRIKAMLAELERSGAEPQGSDHDLIADLDGLARGEGDVGPPPTTAPETPWVRPPDRSAVRRESFLTDLERAFRDAPGPTAHLCEPMVDGREGQGTLVGRLDGGEAGAQTIRVNVATLEHLMTMVSELVLTRNQLLEISRPLEDDRFRVPLQRLSQVTAELQDGVMKTRMQPIGNLWRKLPRVVRDLSTELTKEIELVMAGAETELDRQVLELIKDPLTHMIRNAADHAIETTEERKAAGKPEHGTIRLRASQEGGTITIEIADDGRGLDHDAIRRKAVACGLVGEADVKRLGDAQVAKFIFHPGFSTAAAVTSISGRGVGMDVVKSNIELIGGAIEIRSEKGRGTTFTIKIPLTLAIVAALIVSVKDERFAIPQLTVLELVRVVPDSEHSIETINGTPLLRLRERLLPIVRLSEVLNPAEPAVADDGFVVVTQVGRQRFGILVHGVSHTQEIVVKPMSSKLRHLELFSGNTILGDGAVVLIVDPNGLARTIGSASGELQIPLEDGTDSGGASQNDATALLIFRGGGESLKAIPLSLVTRLEAIDASTIEWAEARPLVQYRGRLVPIVAADGDLEIKREGSQPLVVFSDGDRTMGLAVREIVDIVDETLVVELPSEGPDLIGTAVIRGRATELVDVAHYLTLAHDDWTRPAAAPASGTRSVLLVDGSAFFRDLLTPVLNAAGYRVHHATSAEGALTLLGTGIRIDALVTDMDMPAQVGFELARTLRADQRFDAMPIIALASSLDMQVLRESRELCFAAFVAKSDRSGLLSALAETQPVIGEAA
jgi:two-component system chemotaxis sensor kinase CheA